MPAATKGVTQSMSRLLEIRYRAIAAAGGDFLAIAAAACSTAGPFVPDTRGKATKSQENISADDVFKRAPWELWRMPTGSGRYHRGTGMLLPDKLESFEVSDVSVYKADGSDVRIDYFSVDLGGGSQSHESITVFVYRTNKSPDAEWRAVTDDVRRQWPDATPTSPFAVPAHHPEDTRQLAWVAPAHQGAKGETTFVQTLLFRVGEWAVRYDITCPADDLDATREKTRTFLRSIRAQEYTGRTN
jgi:hypothetical protein